MDGSECLGVSGSALWAAIHGSRDVRPEHKVLVLNACRIADRLDELSGNVPLTVLNAKGDEVANPVFTEHRMQLQTLKTIMSALGIDRLSVSDSGPSLEDALAKAREARLGAVG